MERCLVNGKHTPGSQWEAECPLLAPEERLELRARLTAGRPPLTAAQRASLVKATKAAQVARSRHQDAGKAVSAGGGQGGALERGA